MSNNYTSCKSPNVIIDRKEYERLKKTKELLSILKDSPFILQKIFENKELKNQEQYDKKYFWGTITEDKVIKIKEWLENEEKD